MIHLLNNHMSITKLQRIIERTAEEFIMIVIGVRAGVSDHCCADAINF